MALVSPWRGGARESSSGGHDPGPAMSRLIAGFDDAYVSYANNADLSTKSTWQTNAYRVQGGSSPNKDILRIAYGKDGSGNPHYAAISDASTDCLFYVSSADLIAGNNWTRVEHTPDGPNQHDILYANGVWISVGYIGGGTKIIYRSTNGTSWTKMDLTSLLSGGANNLQGLTSDGAGTWWMGGGTKIFKSTDDGATWALEADISSLDVVGIRHMVYTNSTVVALVKHTSGGTDSIRIVTAAPSDTTDWGTPVAADDGTGGSGKMSVTNTKRCAAGTGRVICIDTGFCMSFDVSGKTASRISNRINIADAGGAGGSGNSTDIATDGEGNWYISCTGTTGADLVRSTDNGANWSAIVTDIDPGSSTEDMTALAVDRYLPL